MTNEKLQDFKDVADTFEKTAEKVEDGINKVLEPEVKETRISAYDTQRMVEQLAKQMTRLFAVSILINLATLIYVVTTL